MSSRIEGISKNPISASEGVRSRGEGRLTTAFRNWWDSPFNSDKVYYYDSGVLLQVSMHLIGLASTPVSYPFCAAIGTGRIFKGAIDRDSYEATEGFKMLAAPVTALATVVSGIATGLAKTATLPLRVVVGVEK